MSTFIERPRFTCALGGALSTVNALPRTVPILHASVGCGGMSSAAVNGASGYLGSGYCGGNAAPASAITEKEVVFGGAERLSEQIQNTVKIIDADLFVVITGCTSEIIGDDVSSVVREYNETRADNPPVIFTSGAGFKGDSLFGYDSVLQSLITNYMNKGLPVKKNFVNLWGIPPALDVFWEGNLLELRRILELLGLEVNTFFTSYDSLDTIKNASQSALNIVVSSVYGIEAAELFQKEFNTPYISTLFPIGAQSTEEFIEIIGNHLSIDNMLVDQIITSEKQKYYRFLNRISDAYSDIDLQRYSVIIGDANYSFSLTNFVVKELGWLPHLVIITDQLTEEQKIDILNQFNEISNLPTNSVVFETDTNKVSELLFEHWPRPDGSRYYRSFSPAFVIGSRLDKDFADSIGAGHLSVSFPVSNRVILDKNYSGFTGGLHLVEDIYSTILNSR